MVAGNLEHDDRQTPVWLSNVPLVTESLGNPLTSRVLLHLAFTDHLRSLATFGALTLAQPWLAHAPRGHGQPVLVLPGMTTGDLSTLALRRFLQRLGYSVYGWGLGLNIGPTRRVLRKLPQLVDQIAREHGQPVTIIGWSLGGNFARMCAREVPAASRQVITLGSPISLTHPKQVASMNLYMMLARFHAPASELPPHESTLPALPVPGTSIFSRWDGIVEWHACLGEHDGTHENLEVRASHTGYGHDPAVLWAIADRLAQPGNSWKPFKPPRFTGLLYPSRDADPDSPVTS